MSAHFAWYDDWKTPVLTCPRCGWQGTFNEGAVGEYDQLMDSSCPKCWKLVAIVLYPTIAESRANWDKLSDVEKQWVDGLDAAKQAFDAAKLKDVEQLPGLGGDEIRLLWDFETDDQGEGFTGTGQNGARRRNRGHNDELTCQVHLAMRNLANLLRGCGVGELLPQSGS